MAEFVNKVKKNDVEYEIRDARIEELSDVVSLDGTSLVIPEQPAPEPIITIDGVAYYHVIDSRQLFMPQPSPTRYYYKNIGSDMELVTETPELPYLMTSFTGGSGGDTLSWKLISSDYDYMGRSQTIKIYDEGNELSVSGAITIQDTIAENTLNSTYFTNAYLAIDSEDAHYGKVYFNLVSDSNVPEHIDSVKQGASTIPLVDERLPEASASDEGKTLSVDASGNYQLATASGGGTQLYKHVINGLRFANEESDTILTFISNFNTPAIEVSSEAGPTRIIFESNINNPVVDVLNNADCMILATGFFSYAGNGMIVYRRNFDSISTRDDLTGAENLTDTVTAL